MCMASIFVDNIFAVHNNFNTSINEHSAVFVEISLRDIGKDSNIILSMQFDLNFSWRWKLTY